MDSIGAGIDFIEAIEHVLNRSSVLLVIIGKHWVEASDEHGRRIDHPEDLVRYEIATALKNDITVIPVLVDGAAMPKSIELPEELRPLVRRNAFSIRHESFDADAQRLTTEIGSVVVESAELQGLVDLDSLAPKGIPDVSEIADFNIVGAHGHPLRHSRSRLLNEIKPDRKGWILIGYWCLANFCGIVIGALLGSMVRSIYFGPNIILGVAAVILGCFVFGAIVGLSQWMVLRKYLAGKRWWILATAWALAGNIILGSFFIILISKDKPGTFGEVAIILAFLGAILGLSQWLVIRRQLLGAGWWVIANAVGLALGPVILLTSGIALNWLLQRNGMRVPKIDRELEVE